MNWSRLGALLFCGASSCFVQMDPATEQTTAVAAQGQSPRPVDWREQERAEQDRLLLQQRLAQIDAEREQLARERQAAMMRAGVRVAAVSEVPVTFVPPTSSLQSSAEPAGSQPQPPVEVAAARQIEVEASAPRGLSELDLGRPFDAEFRPIGVGPDGGSLFPEAAIHRVPIDEARGEFVRIEDGRQLQAHAGAWGIEASVGNGTAKRFATFRARQVREMVVVDDTAQMRSAPPGAVFYLWRVFVGHSYEAVFSGDERSFHAGIAASFLIFSGGIEAWARENRLAFSYVGRGLRPRSGNAIFASTPEEVHDRYEAAADAPVAVLAVYRSIPHVVVPDADPIPWSPPPTLYRLELVRISALACEDAFSGCDMNARFWPAGEDPSFAQWQSGPEDQSTWDMSWHLLARATGEAVERGVGVEVKERDDVSSDDPLGQCQVRFSEDRISQLAAADHPWEGDLPCGNVQLRLRLTRLPP